MGRSDTAFHGILELFFSSQMHRGSEVKDGKTHSEGMVQLNVTAAKLGWDIYIKESSVKDQADIETDYEGSFKYYW